MAMAGTLAYIVIGAVVVVGIVVALVVMLGRRSNDWAGDPRPPQQPYPSQQQQPQPPQQPTQPPRSIDDSQRFREQNRPTDPPPPA